MNRAEAIARYFVLLAAQEPEPELLSHLRVQKLLYFAQGWSLALRGRPLFASPIEAWVHGPVVRSVYPKFADYGDQPIAFHEGRDGAALPAEDAAMTRAVWECYKGFSAIRLRQMTHAEPPYLRARDGLHAAEASDREIPQGAIALHFARMQSEAVDRHGVDLADLLQAADDFRQGRSVPLREIA